MQDRRPHIASSIAWSCSTENSPAMSHTPDSATSFLTGGCWSTSPAAARVNSPQLQARLGNFSTGVCAGAAMMIRSEDQAFQTHLEPLRREDVMAMRMHEYIHQSRVFSHRILASGPGILARSPDILAPSPGWNFSGSGVALSPGDTCPTSGFFYTNLSTNTFPHRRMFWSQTGREDGLPLGWHPKVNIATDIPARIPQQRLFPQVPHRKVLEPGRDGQGIACQERKYQKTVQYYFLPNHTHVICWYFKTSSSCAGWQSEVNKAKCRRIRRPKAIG